MCDSRDSSPSCVFHGNLDGVIEEDNPLGPGEVSVFFHASENATLGFPNLYYTLHATICWDLLSQTPFSIMSGIMCGAAGPSGNRTLHPGRAGAMLYQRTTCLYLPLNMSLSIRKTLLQLLQIYSCPDP